MRVRTPSVLREAATGFAYFGRGMVSVASRPRLFGLGILPPLVSSAVLFSALIGLANVLVPAIAWATPFANGWVPLARDLTRTLIGAGILVAFVVLGVVTFGAVTLALGAPFYERISGGVEAECGGLPVTAARRGRPLRGTAKDLVTQGAISLAATAGVLLIGLVPAIGSLAAPVVGVLVGGWLLSLELVQTPFERRGVVGLAARRGAFRRRRAHCLGFGIPVALCFLVPLVGVLTFPGAVAGGTLLARSLRGESTTLVPRAAAAGPSTGPGRPPRHDPRP